MKPSQSLFGGTSVLARGIRRTVGIALVTASLTTKAPTQEPSDPNTVKRKMAAQAARNLRTAWAHHLSTLAARQATPPDTRVRPELFIDPAVELQQEAALTAPRRQSLARASTALYLEPDTIRSQNHELRTTLVSNYLDGHIGADPVHLRSYNGKLVGPTLRLRPGDTLHMTLKNDMPVDFWQPNMMNELNSFNTTNMHFHGLHVSPTGISDNVLIEVGPKATQEYVVHVPQNHPAGTFWYHAHRHGSTVGDVASSMSGALIIEGGLDDVPEIRAAKERVMVLNQIPYLYKNVLPDSTDPNKKVTFNFPAGIVEAECTDYIFGPGEWETLGRYTTVNGVQLPVFRMRPGEVERWRIVDSGQRETIHLRIVPEPTRGGSTGQPLTFHEIAVDGLALGKTTDKAVLDLWPGYRSDVLVKAPLQPGRYLVINDAAPGTDSINGEPSQLTYVGRLEVAGQPRPMALPSDRKMAKFRLPSIKDIEITGRQSAAYGILFPSNASPLFTIDGVPFQMETARNLKLGDVDEWTISDTNLNPYVPHPFHIHVNPFEVTSIMGPLLDKNGQPVIKDGKPVLQEQLKGGPVWHDTIMIPGGGYVKMRTHYTDFMGTFVQHCHILDHEDQGMMQLINIVGRNASQAENPQIPKQGSVAPNFLLPNASGLPHALADDPHPTLVFFFRGNGCVHCSLQVAALSQKYEQFRKLGVQVIGISTDDSSAVKAALASSPCPFPILSDSKGVAFQAYGCVGSTGFQHGTFLLDTNHRVVWRTVGASPYMEISDLLARAQTMTHPSIAAKSLNPITQYTGGIR